MVLDAVPTDLAQQAPGQAVISQITSAAGIVHLSFDAPHATRFDVLRKLEADTDYEKLTDDIIEKTFDTAKQDAGDTLNF